MLLHKLRKLQRAIRACLKKHTVSAGQLAQIIGQCVSIMKAIVPAKLLLRCKSQTCRQSKNADSKFA